MRFLSLALLVIFVCASDAQALGRRAAPPPEPHVVRVEIELISFIPSIPPLAPPAPIHGPPMPPHTHNGPCVNQWLICPGEFWRIIRAIVATNSWLQA